MPTIQARRIDRLLFHSSCTVWRARLIWSVVRRTLYHLPPAGPTAAKYVTLVARMPDAITAGLAPALDDLRRMSPSHHYYAPANIHLTILNLDAIRTGFRTETDLIQAVRSIVTSHSSFGITAVSLNVSPETVFTRVVPHDDTLSRLRENIAALSPTNPRCPWIVDLLRRLRRRFAVANVVRFSGVITPSFAVAIRRWREAIFGCGVIAELELVRTDRFLSSEGTEVIARMSLGRNDRLHGATPSGNCG